MAYNKKLIDLYLKSRNNIPLINNEDKNFILASKDGINQQFKKDNFHVVDIIDDYYKKLEQLNSKDGLSVNYLNTIYHDLLYFSFSTSGYPLGGDPKVDNQSKIKVSDIIKTLQYLKNVTLTLEKPTDIIDAIINQFSKF